MGTAEEEKCTSTASRSRLNDLSDELRENDNVILSFTHVVIGGTVPITLQYCKNRSDEAGKGKGRA